MKDTQENKLNAAKGNTYHEMTPFVVLICNKE